jgi:riboflavin-specific deaminase-like protein
MPEKPINNLWEIILKLKDRFSLENSSFYLSFPINNNPEGITLSETSQMPDRNKILISYNKEPNSGWALNVNYSDDLNWPIFDNNTLPNDLFVFCKRYLPYVLLKLKSHQNKSALTIGHLAMSLDGKIATKNGHSQWIGNKINQIHSHRMRALADAILVGGNTFEKDKPQLNVRHVTGNNPIKIVMGDGDYKIESIDDYEDIIRVSSNKKAISNIETITIDRDSDGFKCSGLLTKLFKKNIQTVYIEGGGITLSGFIKCKSLTVLQLHYAPILMGSGIPCITLPDISEVGQAITFKEYQIEQMDDEWMFSGVLNYDN